MLRAGKSTLMAMGLAAVVSAGVITATGGPAAAAAGGCQAGHFCAFADAGFGNKILDSTAGRGTNAVEVAHDQTTSGSNVTGNKWVGVSVRTGLPDQTIFTFAANTDVSNVGSAANDKIDHFDVR